MKIQLNKKYKLKRLSLVIFLITSLIPIQTQANDVNLKAEAQKPVINIPKICNDPNQCKIFTDTDQKTDTSRSPIGHHDWFDAWYIDKNKEKTDGKTLIVKGSNPNVKLIYVATTDDSAVGDAQHKTYMSANNNSLIIDGGEQNKRKQFKIGGVSVGKGGDRGGIPTIATAGLLIGEASHNNLYIRNSDIELTKDEHTSIFTAFVAQAAKPNGKSPDVTISHLNNNTLLIENVSIKNDPTETLHNTAIGATFTNSVSTYVDNVTPLTIEANNNQVWILGSEIEAYMIAGVHTDIASQNGKYDMQSNNNSVYIKDSIIDVGRMKSDSISSGGIWASRGSDYSKNNLLDIRNSTISINRHSFTHQSDQLSIGGTFGSGITADNSKVSLYNTKFTVSKQGAYMTDIGINGGSSIISNGADDLTKTALNNEIIIKNTDKEKYAWTLDNDQYVYVKGGRTITTRGVSSENKEASKASENKVVIDNLKAGNVFVTGGDIYSRPGDLGSGIANNNEVYITNTELLSSQIIGAYSPRGEASYNRIDIDGLTITGRVALLGSIIGETGKASNNTLTIKNSKIIDDGQIIGGAIKANNGASEQNYAQNNIVTIGENVTNLQGKELNLEALYGGMFSKGVGVDRSYLGNTLNLYSQVVTKNLGGFQKYNFFINDKFDLTKPLLSSINAQNAVTFVTNKDRQNSKVSINTTLATLPKKVVLIHSEGGFIDNIGAQFEQIKDGDVSHILGQGATIKQYQSIARVANYNLSKDNLSLSVETDKTAGQNLVLDIKGNINRPDIDTNNQTDPLMEASISTLATMYAADELFVDTLNRNINRSYDGMFVTSRGGYYSIDTRNRVEANVFNALIGYGTKAINGEIGVFTELGHSSYDTYSFDSNGQRAPGSGKHNYVGAGIFANQEILDTGVKASAYFKLGSFRNDFDTNILGTQYDFDRTSGYIGAHLGLAKDVSITDKVNARFYGSYFYDVKDSETYDQNGTNGSSGARFTYDDIQSHRLQFGTMITCNISDTFKPYASIGFEQVLDAKATGYAEDNLGKLDLHETDMEGITGITSIGINYVKENVELGAGVAGHFGTRNGGNAQIQAKFSL